MSNSIRGTGSALTKRIEREKKARETHGGYTHEKEEFDNHAPQGTREGFSTGDPAKGVGSQNDNIVFDSKKCKSVSHEPSVSIK